VLRTALAEAALAEHGNDGARLEVEITEYALVQHYVAARAALTRLREIGVRIAVDDFGTGAASLSNLRGFQFDRIKIDQSFIAGMTESTQGGAIVRAILQLASSLQIAATAEGVETRAQVDLLANNGCDEAQGYFFGPPTPANEIVRLLMVQTR
jgi:EAL domain-containing protein (putative c-di-GMP-specific phosphodiesterase class I)